jgi:hypothetical protein
VSDLCPLFSAGTPVSSTTRVFYAICDKVCQLLVLVVFCGYSANKVLYDITLYAITFVCNLCRWFSVDTPVFSRYRALYPTSREKACGFYPRPGQTKDYKIVICCFSTKHTVLRSKCKDCLTRNQDNISEWRGMSTRGLFFQRTKRVGLVQSRHHHHLIECNLFSP